MVPAGATGTLRCEIRRQWTQTKSEATEGVVSREAWLRVMATAVETVLSHRDWQRAFEGIGVTKQQNCISSHTLKALQWDECPKIPAGRPSVGKHRVSSQAAVLEVATLKHGERVRGDDSLIPYIRTLN